jgi:hypothetical protein
VWRRISEVRPRSALGRQIDRAWIALRQWASQPAVAALAVFAVVGGSFVLSRATGPGGRGELHAPSAGGLRGLPEDFELIRPDEGSEERDGEDAPEMMLAQASFDDGLEAGEPAAPESAGEDAGEDAALRIEIQTRDPNVRIIWFTPTEDHAAGVED